MTRGTVVYFSLLLLLAPVTVFSQCCSAGSGSPIAGGTSQGVLSEKQFELNTNLQHIYTEKYFKGDQLLPDTTTYFTSSYNYFRLAYGLSKKLTLSLESGYYFNKTDFISDSLSFKSGGIGDLIIFPRYELFNKAGEKHKTEITIGLGFKIPLGKYNDSIGQIEPFSGNTFWITMPPAVQASSGANDLILYGFYFHEFLGPELKVFGSLLHVRKGWNPLGEKFGDYSSVGLFVSRVFKKKLGVTLQVKAENMARMKYNEDAYLMGSYLYDVTATGGEKLFFVPQVSFGFFKGKLTAYALTEIPLYQRLNGSQIGSQRQFVAGLSWRFFMNKPISGKSS